MITLSRATATRTLTKMTCSRSVRYQRVPPDYHECFLFRWARAISEVASHLRNDVLLPLDPRENDGGQVFTHVESGIGLPAWHCPFLTWEADGRCEPCQAAASDSCKKHGLYWTYEKIYGHISA